MADSTSNTPNNGQENPNDFQAFVACFGNFRVSEDGALRSRILDLPPAIVDGPSVSFPSTIPATRIPEEEEEDVNGGDKQTQKRSDQLLAAQETPKTTQGLSRNLVFNQGVNCDTGAFIGSSNFNSMDSMYFSQNLGANGQGLMNIFNGNSSISDPVNLCNGMPVWNDAFGNHGLYSPVEQFGFNSYDQRSFSGLWKQNGVLDANEYRRSNFYSNGTESPMGSNGYQGGNFQETQFTVFRESFLQLMVDESGHFVFDKLINSCTGDQLHLIISTLLSDIELFIQTAFCRIGSSSIQKLIKKLKKTRYASTMTRILSTRYYEIMTHGCARHVIIQCLNLLSRKSNEVLYECAIYYFQDLAIHEVGCRSLNECINSIAGEQRDRLLNRIALVSAFLANDPYGNYVVQHVLDLRNNPITEKVLCCLQGQFTQLSKTKGGSHVVEKCIESSTYGSRLVAKEILDSSTCIQLCSHPFGNYVIQKALMKTKEEGQMHLHEHLVKILKRGEQTLKRTGAGKYVLTLVEKLKKESDP